MGLTKTLRFKESTSKGIVSGTGFLHADSLKSLRLN